jgi:hypothetical protein
LRLGRYFVLAVMRRRPDALLRPDVDVPSLLDETPLLEKAVAERLRILQLLARLANSWNVEHME